MLRKRSMITVLLLFVSILFLQAGCSTSKQTNIKEVEEVSKMKELSNKFFSLPQEDLGRVIALTKSKHGSEINSYNDEDITLHYSDASFFDKKGNLYCRSGSKPYLHVCDGTYCDRWPLVKEGVRQLQNFCDQKLEAILNDSEIFPPTESVQASLTP